MASTIIAQSASSARRRPRGAALPALSRVGAPQHGEEVGHVHPRVERGAADAAVAEQLLHVPDVGASPEEVSGAGVAQQVR
jgi:hypothetical protein